MTLYSRVGCLRQGQPKLLSNLVQAHTWPSLEIAYHPWPDLAMLLQAVDVQVQYTSNLALPIWRLRLSLREAVALLLRNDDLAATLGPARGSLTETTLAGTMGEVGFFASRR